MDEFEIKPLNEGLGFHKKSKNLGQHVKDSGLLEDKAGKIPSTSVASTETKHTRMQFDEILKALERPTPGKASSVRVTQPLPTVGSVQAKPEIELPKAPPFPNPFPTPVPTPQKNRPDHTPLSKVVQNVGLRRGAADSPVRMLERASVSFSSAFLDAIVILALSLLFLVALMTVTKIDLAALVLRSGLDFPMQISFGVLFGSVLLMYVVVSRSFFGRTLGEWTFDLQMGDDAQHLKALYPIRVVFRSFLVMATGLILLPILSWALDKDILAPATGLQLYRHR